MFVIIFLIGFFLASLLGVIYLIALISDQLFGWREKLVAYNKRKEKERKTR
jgi:uncharacterized protein YybS (DUF2232 family)